MLILTNPGTADKISMITSSTAPIDVVAAHMDATTGAPPVPDAPLRTVTAVVTAATTDIVAGPASGKVRNVKTLHVRNKSAAANNDVTIQMNVGGTLYELFKATLRPGDILEYVEGVGFFVISAAVALTNKSVTAQAASFAADTYLVGSNITIPTGAPIVGTMYICTFDMTKTAAGLATPILNIRLGTAAGVGDTSRGVHTFTAGTAAVDTGVFTVTAEFRTVGSGTSAVLQSRVNLDSNPTTGISGLIHASVNTSAGFDSTPAGNVIGVSFNGGASFVGTVQLVEASLVQR